MRIKYNKSSVTEAIYSEEYCDICGEFKKVVELEMANHIEPEIFYVAICKNCLEKLLKDFNTFEKEN